MDGKVSVILAEPKGGQREFSFDSGAKLARWVWENKTGWFTDVKKGEQTE